MGRQKCTFIKCANDPKLGEVNNLPEGCVAIQRVDERVHLKGTLKRLEKLSDRKEAHESQKEK